MTFLIIGTLFLGIGFWLRRRFQRKNHSPGVEATKNILYVALILIIFYGILSSMTIL